MRKLMAVIAAAPLGLALIGVAAGSASAETPKECRDRGGAVVTGLGENGKQALYCLLNPGPALADTPSSSPSTPSAPSTGILKHRVVSQPGKKCFSMERVPEAGPGTRPRMLRFHCMPAGPKADLLAQKADAGQPLPELAGLKPNHEEMG
ncbi:hypothetical protein ACFVX6_39850 [Streptomyces sp. NPDC058289]|uniref:hypothetical protein n=1 Tax=Streptomyces sp. NPDC058289 TaxID=3346425 RepID=UPI0036E7ACF3